MGGRSETRTSKKSRSKGGARDRYLRHARIMLDSAGLNSCHFSQNSQIGKDFKGGSNFSGLTARQPHSDGEWYKF